jgi:hypothetical protein
VADILAVDQDMASRGVVKAWNQAGQRRFASARTADKRDPRATGNMQIDTVQDLAPLRTGAWRICEAHAREVDRAATNC